MRGLSGLKWHVTNLQLLSYKIDYTVCNEEMALLFRNVTRRANQHMKQQDVTNKSSFFSISN